MGRPLFRVLALALVATALSTVLAGSAAADDWMPHPAGAKWTYVWADSSYSPSGTTENVVVQKQAGTTWTLAWADPQNTPPPASETQLSCPFSLTATGVSSPDRGVMTFRDTNSGLQDVDWNSCPPPPSAPILCASAANCPNSLSSALYNVIWGSRQPLLSEPLLAGTTWTSTGGAQNDVSSSSRYLGIQKIKVPAFPAGVPAAVVRSNIVQAGALGDPYGSGVRTTWWVRGVGPVRVTFQHDGGSYAPLTNVELQATNLTPAPPQPDIDYFPIRTGLANTYRWTNSRWLKQAELIRVNVAASVNRSVRFTVRSVSGPLKVAGQYGFTQRLDGVSTIFGSASAATLLAIPRFGPRDANGQRQRFLDPFDLMAYGYNPILPAYPALGAIWRSGNPKDAAVYGATGTTRILGIQRVRVPAGTFEALAVQSRLNQRVYGRAFGSGVRTEWFAPGRGLVKLLFRHGDRSVTLVQLTK